MNEMEHQHTSTPSPDESADRTLLKLLFKLGGSMLAVLLAATLVIGGLVALAVWKVWTSGTLAD